MHWACEVLNRTSTTVNPESKSPYEMWNGSPARVTIRFSEAGILSMEATTENDAEGGEMLLRRSRIRSPAGLCASADT